MKERNSFLKYFLSTFILITIFLFSHTVLADSTTGYAWSENTGYLDFSEVSVDDNALSGYAYGSNIGWISMNCTNTSSCNTTDYKVSNTKGVLSGYAWSENTGYLDFSQVTIDTGIFSGSAYSSNIGWISMNCTNTSSCNTTDYKVTTNWRPASIISGSRPSRKIPPPPLIPLPPVTTPSTPPTTSCLITMTLKLTYRGRQVQCLQENLLITPDGIFGPKTRQAVIDFQLLHNLKPDGIVGPITRSFININ